MLVQESSPPKFSNPSVSHNVSLNPDRISAIKNLDFSTWFGENIYKIVIVFILLLTVAALFLLRSVGDTAAFFCFEEHAKEVEKVAYPKVKWDSVQVVVDKYSSFANFRSERWIIVSVSSYPTDSLRNLVKIKGWQLLAVGNSKAPSDWSLKGAIYLSLEDQSKLGFRVNNYLPFSSYVRKTLGYLFAIQHGARKIFDADDRGDVIGNDFSKHFDLDLAGENAKQQIMLQYSHGNPNRTVVNPYIHFGQRSVWPRGLPLENVGEVEHEEFYTEVYSGKQFIQQGISNGLPDVDSVFYFTRKSGIEALDIRFDEHAPKVALPHGLMVPLNSFNTLFHSSSFWGLMLPVSVSTMASDVMRGYWAQRILWEIGGHVAVYPPTIHRFDRVESYPFSEEKDLHVNVGNLIKFLSVWRSSKHMLFEKILELSYSMAEEGFWGKKDVEFTAAWLQDLLSVGYLQPRLMAIDLAWSQMNFGDGDRREFVPQKLLSVHLGVEETGTVSYEIGNLIRWRKAFGNVVLIMFCTGPVERTALEWRLLYGRIFKTVVIFSNKTDENLAVEEGHVDVAYKYLPKVFQRYGSAEGFLFLRDDTILNYWNLLQADKNKLWITYKAPKSWRTVGANQSSGWYAAQKKLVEEVVGTMPVHFQVMYRKNMGGWDGRGVTVCGSEVFFIPRRLVGDFADLVDLVGGLEVHHTVAVPMFFLSMDAPGRFDPVLDSVEYLAGRVNRSGFYPVTVPAVRPWGVSDERGFIELVRGMGKGDPLLMELF